MAEDLRNLTDEIRDDESRILDHFETAEAILRQYDQEARDALTDRERRDEIDANLAAVSRVEGWSTWKFPDGSKFEVCARRRLRDSADLNSDASIYVTRYLAGPRSSWGFREPRGAVLLAILVSLLGPSEKIALRRLVQAFRLRKYRPLSRSLREALDRATTFALR